MLRHEARRTLNGIVLTLYGDLDTFAARYLDANLMPLLASVPGHLTIDLSQLGYLSGAGARALLRLRATLSAAGASLSLTEPNPAVRRMLEHCALNTVFVVTVPDAVA